MTLENFKQDWSAPSTWLRLALALVFLSAGLFRIFNPAAAAAELTNLNLPVFFTWFILVIELGGGLLLFLGKQTRWVAVVFIVFLVFALVSALATNGKEIISTANELFVFNPEPTDFFLHAIFLLILITLAVYPKQK